MTGGKRQFHYKERGHVGGESHSKQAMIYLDVPRQRMYYLLAVEDDSIDGAPSPGTAITAVGLPGYRKWSFDRTAAASWQLRCNAFSSLRKAGGRQGSARPPLTVLEGTGQRGWGSCAEDGVT